MTGPHPKTEEGAPGETQYTPHYLNFTSCRAFKQRI